jgi:chorismate mutase
MGNIIIKEESLWEIEDSIKTLIKVCLESNIVDRNSLVDFIYKVTDVKEN